MNNQFIGDFGPERPMPGGGFHGGGPGGFHGGGPGGFHGGGIGNTFLPFATGALLGATLSGPNYYPGPYVGPYPYYPPYPPYQPYPPFVPFG